LTITFRANNERIKLVGHLLENILIMNGKKLIQTIINLRNHLPSVYDFYNHGHAVCLIHMQPTRESISIKFI